MMYVVMIFFFSSMIQLNYVNIEDQGRHPPQAQAGDIELPQIIVDNYNQ